MKSLRQHLTDLVSEEFLKLNYDEKFGSVTVSNRPDLCQFQCNGALGLAKQLKKNPAIIANELVDILKGISCFEEVSFAPPGFINLILSDDFLSGWVQEMSTEPKLGLITSDAKKKIMIDYGGPNIAKPLHVGHLRPAVIGEALKRMAVYLGHDLTGDVHLGDWGFPIGLIIKETELRYPSLDFFKENYTGDYEAPPITIDDLNEIYPTSSKRAKEDEAFRKSAQKAVFDLQNGRRGYMALWKYFVEISVHDMKKIYHDLNVDFDIWFGESNAESHIPGMIKALEESGLAYISDGALVVDVKEDSDTSPVPPILIRKSDGSGLYGTTDVATIIQRMKDFSPDEIWYVTDNRQSLHFKQVFRCARKAGFIQDDTVLAFFGNGTVNGSDGKPYKTRDGGIMKLSDLIQTVDQRALEQMSNVAVSDMSGEEKNAIAHKVGVSAIKFGDLINQRTKDYIFDIDKFLSFEGKTGPYLLYTAVRIGSVLEKAASKGLVCRKIIAPASRIEQDLLLQLANTGEVLIRAYEDKMPNIICEAAYDVASAFNRFYYENKILIEENEERRASWLSILNYTRELLITLLDILGIEVPEKM